jgi:hypothetical protein
VVKRKIWSLRSKIPLYTSHQGGIASIRAVLEGICFLMSRTPFFRNGPGKKVQRVNNFTTDTCELIRDQNMLDGALTSRDWSILAMVA